MTGENGLTGKLLIAMPGIGDDRFDRSVVLVCVHNEDHAMGIVLNRVADNLGLQELLQQLDVDAENDGELPDGPVLIGGPVGADRGFVLHSDDFESVGATLPVADGLRLTATRQVLESLATSNAPARSRLSLGYAGWGPDQLENEIRQNVWLVADADEAIVFDTDFDAKWVRALERIGVRPDQLPSGLTGQA